MLQSGEITNAPSFRTQKEQENIHWMRRDELRLAIFIILPKKILARLPEAPGEAWTAIVIDMVETPIFYLLKNTHIQPFDIHPPDQTPQDRIWIPDLEIQN